MTKKLLSLIMVLCIVVTIMSTAAMAAISINGIALNIGTVAAIGALFGLLQNTNLLNTLSTLLTNLFASLGNLIGGTTL